MERNLPESKLEVNGMNAYKISYRSPGMDEMMTATVTADVYKRQVSVGVFCSAAFSASASSSACVIRFSTKSRWVSFLPVRSVSRSK